MAFALLALVMLADQQLPVIVRRRPDAPAAEAVAEPPVVEAEVEAEEAPKPIPSRRTVLGEWRLGYSRGGQTCVVRFDDIPMGFGLYSLAQSGQCPDGLFSAIRWRLDADGLTLADRSGKVLARLAQNEDGVWQGERSGIAYGTQLVMGRSRNAAGAR